MVYTGKPAVRITCTCIQCGNNFEAEPYRVRDGVKYCSKECARLGSVRRQICTCLRCGKQFEEEPAQIARGGGKYCSVDCFRYRNYQTNEIDIPRSKLVEKTCDHCGKLFTFILTYKGKGRRKYCSKTCQSAALEKKIECVCQECGKMFKVKPSHVARGVGKYCSMICYKNAGRSEFRCQTCGKQFTVKNSRKKQGVKFCSYECSISGKLKPIFRNCDYCGKEYRTTAAKINRGFKGYYCSYECSCLGRRTSQSEIVCAHCGIIFSGYPDRQKYCSRKCTRESQVGENHHAWRGGHDDYRGDNWNKQRKLAYTRDGGVCQSCHRKPNKGERKFPVHHIKPFRDFNGNYIAANDLSNLITLCHQCHPKAEHGKITLQPKLL